MVIYLYGLILHYRLDLCNDLNDYLQKYVMNKFHSFITNSLAIIFCFNNQWLCLVNFISNILNLIFNILTILKV